MRIILFETDSSQYGMEETRHIRDNFSEQCIYYNAPIRGAIGVNKNLINELVNLYKSSVID